MEKCRLSEPHRKQAEVSQLHHERTLQVSPPDVWKINSTNDILFYQVSQT